MARINLQPLTGFIGRFSVLQRWWALCLIVLVLIAPLSFLAEPHSYLVYKYLLALFIINAVFYFFLDNGSAILRAVLLIFIFTLELLVIIYFALGIIDTRV